MHTCSEIYLQSSALFFTCDQCTLPTWPQTFPDPDEGGSLPEGMVAESECARLQLHLLGALAVLLVDRWGTVTAVWTGGVQWLQCGQA